MRAPASRLRERGSAMAVAVVFVVLSVSVVGASITVARGWRQEASMDAARERAFQLAEAGIDWAVARMRASHGVLPMADDNGSIGGGAWNVRYASCAANGVDDDGDALVDESDESEFASITCTGESGRVKRALRIVIRTTEPDGAFDSAAMINVADPLFEVDGHAFRIAGAEHLLDGTLDPTRPEKWSVASVASVGLLAGQVPAAQQPYLTGFGAPPAMGQSVPLDVAPLFEEARRAATIVLTPGTHTGGCYGTPTTGGTEVVSCVGDLHLSGGTAGAGVLVVDGDLRVSGGFSWVGLILVRGGVELVGDGDSRRIVGAVIVCDRVGTDGGASLSISGSVDLLFSTDAVNLARRALAVPRIIAWHEVGLP